MPWKDTPCDLEARLPDGSRSGRERQSRVNHFLQKRQWTEHHGRPWPEGMYMCHHCDEPRCSNPEHIFPGTASDNIRDAAKKGRMAGSIHGSGEAHRFAKLTEEDVYAIRLMVGEGWKHRNVAEVFAVAQSTVTRIVNRKRWGGESVALEGV